MEEVGKDWRRLNNEVIKSRRMRWAGHVTRMGETKTAYNIFIRKLE